MDAQHSCTGTRQNRLQRQWKPTDKQPDGDPTCNRSAVTTQPRAWYAGNQIARDFFHTAFSDRQRWRIHRGVGDFPTLQLNRCGL